MKPSVAIAAFAVAVGAAPGCAGLGDTGDKEKSGNPANPGTQPAPAPEEQPIPQVAVYKRGSLAAPFQLTPRNEYGRFNLGGVIMADADFAAVGNAFVSSAQKVDEISQQVGRERGGAAPAILRSAEDRQRAQQIPFRGNPSDVDFLTVNGRKKLYLPLGGDLMTPGNEIAAVTMPQGTVTRVKVGVRPQRTAVHPDGLVFVCNQYSNYISVIDARTDQLLLRGQEPVEIPTEYYCTDILLADQNPQAPDADAQVLYVANSWRGSVLRYNIQILRDPINDRPVDVVLQGAGQGPAQPTAEVTGVGANPSRLSLSESKDRLYVANSRGGELALVDLRDNRVLTRVALNGPTVDAVNIQDSVFVPTTTIDRGLLSGLEPVQPQQVVAGPVQVTGLDGNLHTAHPGALFDRTRSYNFEDLRNGLLQIDSQLRQPQAAVYYTDNISPEANFVAQQKVLSGAIPQAIVRNAAGTRIYLAHSSSDLIQELNVAGGQFKVRASGRNFATQERPFALALDEAVNRLYVANWGGETMQVVDLGSGQVVQTVDLGYAVPNYPATNIERGEFFYYNAAWSNNGRKSCATCHLDELQADGIGFANGATAPTSYHKVPANWNLLTSDSYFWNGSHANNNYDSLAFAAQSRTNCELIAFGLIEGPTSNPATRVGDPNNRVRSGRDAECRPLPAASGQLPPNFDTIADVIAEQKLIADQVIEQATGFTSVEVSRFINFYGVSELRLPPNPLKYLTEAMELPAQELSRIEQGRELFVASGCGNCHDPNNQRAPFTDGLDHGAGGAWTQRFVDTYTNDPRIIDAIGAFPQVMLDALSASTGDAEINVHVDPIDYFSPFCFDVDNCLTFEDPLVVRGIEPAESQRLDLIVRINLADPDRGFIPGNVRGQPKVNTPSLRGIWWHSNFLHHGLANTIGQSILAPGHSGLPAGAAGFAINALGQTDVHGATSTMTPEQVQALVLYVQTIE